METHDFNPYEKEFSLSEIKSGLEFYYKLIDYIDPEVYIMDNFPISRGEIISTINYLKNIPDDHYVNNLIQSHPFLVQAFEGMGKLKDFNIVSEEYNLVKYLIIIWLEYLLFSGCLILFHKYQIDYQIICKDREPKEILKHLIEEKAKFKTNKESYAKQLLRQITEFIDIEIDKNTSLSKVTSSNEISDEANELIKSYLNQINNSYEKNDLFISLQKMEVDKFIYKLKRLLLIPSYFDISKSDKENSFHIYLLSVLTGRLENYNVQSNKESGIGRFDICLFPIDKRNPGVLIEIKKVDETLGQDDIIAKLDGALKQIEKNLYFFELLQQGVKSIIEIGLVFNGLEPNLKWKMNSQYDNEN